MSNTQSIGKAVLILIIALVVGIAGYNFLTMRDNRSTTDRIGDAVHTLPQGLDKATQQLEDRTPGQKLGDTVKDAGQGIKDNTSGN
jgi:uncharacterized protein HemX